MKSATAAPKLLVAPVVRQRHPGLTGRERRAALAVVSDAERMRYDQLNASRGDAFLAGRALLRGLAGEMLGIAPSDVPLSARCIECGGEHGRPVIVGTRLRVSMAHSRDSLVVAACWDRAIGIDLEPLAGRKGRLDAIEGITGVRSLRHWTRVEAVLKADGRGLRVDPRLVRATEKRRSDGIVEIAAALSGSPMTYLLLDVPAETPALVSVALAR